MIYEPKKELARKSQVTGKPAQWKARSRAWRSKSADLEPLGGYQLSVGREMRSEYPDLQTQIRKLQEKLDLEKSKSDDGARRLKTDFFRSRANWKKLAQHWGCSGILGP